MFASFVSRYCEWNSRPNRFTAAFVQLLSYELDNNNKKLIRTTPLKDARGIDREKCEVELGKETNAQVFLRID